MVHWTDTECQLKLFNRMPQIPFVSVLSVTGESQCDPWFVASSSSPRDSVVDYGHALINEDRADTIRLLTRWRSKDPRS
jgi:hypothetical protein